MNLPDYLDDETKTAIQRSALCRAWGHVNVYRCKTCGLSVVTTDVDEGTTPYTMACPNGKYRLGGDHFMSSAMYRVPLGLKPTQAWYRPDTLDGLDTDTAEHVRKGGLIRRDLADAELALLVVATEQSEVVL